MVMMAEVQLSSAGQRRADVTPLASLFTHSSSWGKIKRVYQSHRCRSWRGKDASNTTGVAAHLGSGDQRRLRWVLGPASSETTGSTSGEKEGGPWPSLQRVHLHATVPAWLPLAELHRVVVTLYLGHPHTAWGLSGTYLPPSPGSPLPHNCNNQIYMCHP